MFRNFRVLRVKKEDDKERITKRSKMIYRISVTPHLNRISQVRVYIVCSVAICVLLKSSLACHDLVSSHVCRLMKDFLVCTMFCLTLRSIDKTAFNELF